MLGARGDQCGVALGEPVTGGSAHFDGGAAGQAYLDALLRGAGHRQAQHVAASDEPGHERVRGLVVDLVRGADLLDPAGLHHGDPVRHRHRLGLVVRDVDRGGAALPLDAPDLGAGLLAQLRVEVRQRLVEQHGAGTDDQGPRQRDALLLAAGERVDAPVAVPGEVHLGERLLHPAGLVGAGDPADLEPVRDVLRHSHVREQRVVLEHHAGVPLVRRPVGDVVVAEVDVTGGREVEAGHHAQRRRLAAAARPEQREELAGSDGDGDVIDRRGVARLGEALTDRRQSDIDHFVGPSRTKPGRAAARPGSERLSPCP